MVIRRARVLVAVAAGLVSSCTAGDRTQFVVLVDSDLDVPAELSGFRAVVRDEADVILAEQSFDLVAAAADVTESRYRLPVSFGVGPRANDPTLAVRIEVEASGGTSSGLRRRAVTRFVDGQLLLLPMFLARRCQTEQCADGQTCTENGCESEVVDPAALEVIKEGDEFAARDAGVRARGPDVGPADAASRDAIGVDAVTSDALADAASGDASGADALATDAAPRVDAGHLDADLDDRSGGPTDGGAPTALLSITAPGPGDVWRGSQNITWQTNGPAFDFVEIRLSADSGATFPTRLTAATPNIGSFEFDTMMFGNVASYRVRLIPLLVGGAQAGPAVESAGDFAIRNRRWESASTAGMPVDWWYTQAVWTGESVLAWGGLVQAMSSDVGVLYSPTLDTWVPTSTAGAPGDRIEHVVVWTGDRALVWGGVRELGLRGPVTPGGVYDPVTDGWGLISTLNSPPDAGYRGVWTGDEMLVWGNQMGGRYDPSLDQWRSISNASCPRSSTSATVVWTGQEMVVWGGWAAGGSTNTGGRYEPNGDRWVSTSTVGAPTPRQEHTAVWTGTEMIVWGGGSQNGAGTGGAYDPVRDEWRSLSLVGAPDWRTNHTAVWTGTEVIIWGGHGNSGDLADGAAYDPVRDEWTTLPMAGAPLFSFQHAAVWTGDVMLVFGDGTAARFTP